MRWASPRARVRTAQPLRGPRRFELQDVEDREPGPGQTNFLGDEVAVAIRALLSLVEERRSEAAADAILSRELTIGSLDAQPVLALGSYVLASVRDTTRGTEYADRWIEFVHAGRVFTTGFAWPFAGRAFRLLGRHAEFLEAARVPKIRTPWIAAAMSLADDEIETGPSPLSDMGATGVARAIAQIEHDRESDARLPT